MRRGLSLTVLSAGLTMLAAGCGAPPPEAASLLQRASQHMIALRSFHFAVQVQGDESSPPPLHDADGDARPPDLKARANLRQGQVLLETNVIFVGGRAYLKAFTGGWQEVSAGALAQYVNLPGLFDPRTGLFQALLETERPSTGRQETVDSHKTFMVTGRLPAQRVHRLLPLALEAGDFTAAYWIEAGSDTLWKARIDGKVFSAQHDAAITFTFSRVDEPISITPP